MLEHGADPLRPLYTSVAPPRLDNASPETLHAALDLHRPPMLEGVGSSTASSRRRASIPTLTLTLTLTVTPTPTLIPTLTLTLTPSRFVLHAFAKRAEEEGGKCGVFWDYCSRHGAPRGRAC